MTAPAIEIGARVRVAEFDCWGTIQGRCAARPLTHVAVKLPGGAVLSVPLSSVQTAKGR